MNAVLDHNYFTEGYHMIEFTKDTLLSDVLEAAPESVPMFLAMGMHCLGCEAASGESLGEACEVHDVDADMFVAKLNEFVAAAKAQA